MQTEPRSPDRAAMAVGAVLLIVGALFLAGQLVRVDIAANAWPAFIIVPGIGLLVAGLIVGREAGLGLAIAGSIVTTVGLLLLYQDTAGHWESWAYAWALVGPTGPGVGTALSGLVGGERRLLSNGLNMIAVGLALFLAGLVFFEGVIGIGGRRVEWLSGWIVPAILVVLGVLIVVRGLFFGRAAGPDGRSGPSR